jgi:hypothetical protein
MNKIRKTALLVCDLQTNTINTLFNKPKVIYNVNKLMYMKKYLSSHIPLCAISEFIPNRLGQTDNSISFDNVDMIFSKTTYSMANDTILKSFAENDISDIIITGMEIQWCIAASVRDFSRLNYNMYIPEDAIGNTHTDADNKYNMQYLNKYANILSTDALICKFLVNYDDEASKQYLKIIKRENRPY